MASKVAFPGAKSPHLARIAHGRRAAIRPGRRNAGGLETPLSRPPAMILSAAGGKGRHDRAGGRPVKPPALAGVAGADILVLAGSRRRPAPNQGGVSQ